MLAKLRLDRIVERGEKKLRIAAIENVIRSQDLPMQYMNGVPRFSDVGGGRSPSVIVFIPVNGGNGECSFYTISVGNVYSENDLNVIVEWMRRAGNRLTKINRRLKEENEGWEGQVEITI